MKRLVLACLLFACDSQRYLAPVGTAGTELLLVGESGASSWNEHRVTALTSTFAWTFEVNASTVFEALLFDRTPAELGLTPSWDFRSDRGRTPRSTEFQTFRAAGDELNWTRLDEPSEWVSSVRMPRPCARIHPLWGQPFPDGFGPIAMIPRPDGTAVCVARTADRTVRFLDVSAEGAREIGRLDEAVDFAFGGSDGSIILAGDNRYLTGDPERGFRTLTSTTSSVRMVWSAMNDDGVIFGISLSNALLRIDGESWRVVHQFSESFENPSSGAVEFVGPDDVLVLSRAGRAMYRYRNGQLVREPTDIDADLSEGADRLESIRYLPELGMFAGARGAVLRRRDDGTWGVIRERIITAEVDVLQPFRTGLVISGDGIVDQYYPNFGICEGERHQLGGLVASVGAPIEPGIVLAGIRILDGQTRGHYLTALALTFP